MAEHTASILDAEDGYLQGRARFEAWKARFEAQWFRPLGQRAMEMTWGSMDPMSHAMVRAAGPDAYDQVSNGLGLPNIGGVYGDLLSQQSSAGNGGLAEPGSGLPGEQPGSGQQPTGSGRTVLFGQ